MPGRKFTQANTKHRYGFNGKEKDNENYGEGNSYDFGERIYNPRLGRWFSIDPLQKKYPNESHYAFVSNNPILYADPDGKDKILTITIINKDGSQAQLKIVDENYSFYHTVNSFTKTNGQDWTHKDNLILNYVIDYRKNTNGEISKSVLYETVNENYTWSDRLEEGAQKIFNSTPQYGLTMTGGGDQIPMESQLDWDKNLPKSLQSDFIGSVSGLLDASANVREFAPLVKGQDLFKQELTDLRTFLIEEKGLLPDGGKWSDFVSKLFGTLDNLNDGTNHFQDKIIPKNAQLDPMFKKPGAVIFRQDSKLKTEITDTLGNGTTTNKPATDTFRTKKTN